MKKNGWDALQKRKRQTQDKAKRISLKFVKLKNTISRFWKKGRHIVAILGLVLFRVGILIGNTVCPYVYDRK